MKPGAILLWSFAISVFSSILGAYLKITHAAEAEPLLITAVITWLVFVILAIVEVRASKKIDGSEKTMWTIGLILLSGITGIIYLLIGRKRVTAV